MRSPLARYFYPNKDDVPRWNNYWSKWNTQSARQFSETFLISCTELTRENLTKYSPFGDGTYESWVIPPIERAVESIIGRMFRGLDFLMAGRDIAPRKKYRVSALPAIKSPILFPMSRIPFYWVKTYPERYDWYKRANSKKGARKSYYQYKHAPHHFIDGTIRNAGRMYKYIRDKERRITDIARNAASFKDISLDQATAEAYTRYFSIHDDERHALFHLLVACISQWHDLLLEIRAGKYTSQEKPAIKLSHYKPPTNEAEAKAAEKRLDSEVITI